MNVLHITNWYPNKWNEFESPFVREQFQALKLFEKSELWHVQVRNEGAVFRLDKGKYSDSEKFIILNTKIKRWFFVERFSLFLLIIVRLKIKIKEYDLVNFHIAYPLLRFPRFVKWLFKKKIVITEHWSAYHLGFNLQTGNRNRQKIENIFHYKIPVITVSHSLMNDIVIFSNCSNFERYILPNVVDTRIFNANGRIKQNEQIVFLMVGSWAPIKRPLLVLQAFAKFRKQNRNAILTVIGNGKQLNAMKEFVSQNHLDKSVVFKGRLPKKDISDEMKIADLFLHASEYETFSVVCAEALCCGTPILASDVGGIREFVDSSAGMLVDNNEEAWCKALLNFSSPDNLKKYVHQQIACEYGEKFSLETIGRRYSEILNKICSSA